MELRRVANASTYLTFPMTASGLTITGTWAAWADTAGLTSNGNPGFRNLSGAFTESAATGVYGGFLASTELPAASPYVMLRFTATNAATQYLLITTASVFANVQAVSANAITAAGIASDAITAAKLAADVTTEVQSGLATAAALATVDGIVDDILLDTAEIGAAGAGLTAINLPNQTMDITGNITGNLSGSVGSVTGNVGGNVTGSVGSIGSGGIATTSFAAGAIDAAAIAADAIGAAELAADGASEYADAVLGRNLHRGASGGRTVGQALMALRNKVSISAGTLTVTGENDTTTEWTATIATESVSAIVTSIDPA